MSKTEEKELRDLLNTVIEAIPIVDELIEDDRIHDEIHRYINLSYNSFINAEGEYRDKLCPLVVGCLALLIKQGKLMRVKMEKPVDEDKN